MIRIWVEAVFAGLAQLLFSNRALAGVAVLAAVAVVAPVHALMMLSGVIVATAVAGWSRWNRLLLRDGLFGYNGALIGLVWPALFTPSSLGFWLLVPAAIAATWLHGKLLPGFSRRDLPVLGLPFLLVTWAVSLVGLLAGWRQVVFAAAPVITGPFIGWHDALLRTEVVAIATRGVPALVLTAVALALTSRRFVGAAALGAASGLAVAVALGGAAGLLWVGAFAYNAAVAALGIAVFFVSNRASVVVAIAVSAGAAALWALVTPPLLAIGLFPLTATAHLALFATIQLARSRFARRLGIAALPIHAAPSRVEASSMSTTRRAADIEALAGLLRRSSRVVVLSGAGMSTESGIPDYRSCLGFWFDANPEDLVYQRFLVSARSQRLYWRLQKRFMDTVDRSAPNPGHLALARLDAAGRLLGVITQNVDGFHQEAGTAPGRVVELHGSARWVVCVACSVRTPYREVASRIGRTAPPCEVCGGLLKTETVAFGEPLAPERLNQAVTWCREADLMLLLGSSLQVDPARSLPRVVHDRGAPLVTVNRTATPWDPYAELVIRGDVGTVLEAAVRSLHGRHIRPLTRTDFQFLCRVIDTWWGDAVRYLLHPLWIEHFGDTSFVVEDEHGVAGFLIGFVSQSQPGTAYAHLIATAPNRRGEGCGRALYEHFFALARDRGCREVRAITVPGNASALAFHQRLGFSFQAEGTVWSGDIPVVPDYAGPGVPCVLMTRKL
jgi:NAD-dependent protein deacetylase/lipoamidase